MAKFVFASFFLTFIFIMGGIVSRNTPWEDMKEFLKWGVYVCLGVSLAMAVLFAITVLF